MTASRKESHKKGQKSKNQNPKAKHQIAKSPLMPVVEVEEEAVMERRPSRPN
jgi:hypothetical protein